MNTSINGTGIVGGGVCSLADQWSSILDSLGSPPPATSMFGGNGSNGGATFAAAVAANVANANSNGGGGGGIMDTIIAFLKTGRGKIVLAVVVAIAIAAMVVLYMYLKRRRLRREAEENLALEAALADEVAATLSRLPMQQLSRDTPIPVVAIANANANANANASAMQFCQPPTPPQPTPRPAQPPTPQPAAQPHRGAESESPRNVSGENEFRSFHKLHMSETGGKKQQSDTELPNMPPPDFGAPVSHVATAAAAAAARPVPPGEVAMPPRESHDDAGKLMPMPMPNNVGSVEPVGGPEPVSAAAVAAVALPTLAEDPNFTPLA